MKFHFFEENRPTYHWILLERQMETNVLFALQLINDKRD